MLCHFFCRILALLFHPTSKKTHSCLLTLLPLLVKANILQSPPFNILPYSLFQPNPLPSTFSLIFCFQSPPPSSAFNIRPHSLLSTSSSAFNILPHILLKISSLLLYLQHSPSSSPFNLILCLQHSPSSSAFHILEIQLDLCLQSPPSIPLSHPLPSNPSLNPSLHPSPPISAFNLLPQLLPPRASFNPLHLSCALACAHNHAFTV